MKNLQEATERICELKGSQVALDAFLPAIVDGLSTPARARLLESFDAYAEAVRTVLLHAEVSDLVLTRFERDIARNRALVQHVAAPEPAAASVPAVDALLLATTSIVTFAGAQTRSKASGFFFRRGDRLFLVSNRHVFVDVAHSHFPDRIEFGLHTDERDLTRYTVVSLALYRDGVSLWCEATDTGGKVDVAVIEIPVMHLPVDAVLQTFDESHLEGREEEVRVGDPLTIAGFPMDFHDTVHHLAVARSASIASAYGVRFQRQGCFLTDARTHRGSSGSPVVRRRVRDDAKASSGSWQLLGVHSTRVDMRSRDHAEDEALGLNCAWYADVLLTLTADG